MNKPCFIAVTNRNLCKRPFFDVIEDLSKKDVKTIVLREKDLSEDVARRLGIKKIHLPYPVF